MNCTNCYQEYKVTSIEYKCPNCGSLLLFKSDLSKFKEGFSKNKKFLSFWDFYFTLPPIKKEFIITLNEGGSPCRESKRIGKNIGLNRLFFKDETLNPTNSFKDRAAALLISHARSWGYQKVVCASNGNQGASIAAYTSLEGMECINIIPKRIDIGKHAQLIAYNSKIITKGDTIDDIIDLALEPNYSKEYYQCTPEFNPLTIEAQKTMSFEIFQDIGTPDWIIVPMGDGGCLVSIWKGFNELYECNLIKNLPKIVGVQTQACSPIVDKFFNEPFNKNNDRVTIESRATSILVKKPIYQNLAIKAMSESKGTALAAPESLILSSVSDLAKYEGIFAEPASASTLAALMMLKDHYNLGSDEIVVCLITGSGLKAPYVLEAFSRAKTAGMGGILSTKLKILSQINLFDSKGIHGTRLKEIIGNVSLPAIYQHLKELELKSLVSRKKEGKRVLYFITEQGKKVLDAMDILITLL